MKIILPETYKGLTMPQWEDLERFWQASMKRYKGVCPDAEPIQALLTERGEQIIHDHIALRTFNMPGLDKKTLAKPFEKYGYFRAPDRLEFPSKNLIAEYWIHEDKTLPKIFISELQLDNHTAPLRDWIWNVTKHRRNDYNNIGFNTFLERSWDPVCYRDYQKHYEESDYAAWTAAFGLQPNHYTINYNYLRTFPTFQSLNDMIKSKGIKLNTVGGEIKGSEQQQLEQSSTMSRLVWHDFANGRFIIPGCYYEFAKRYRIWEDDPRFFQGFIPESADKIFESTRLLT